MGNSALQSMRRLGRRGSYGDVGRIAFIATTNGFAINFTLDTVLRRYVY
jgi:hypothetical protein